MRGTAIWNFLNVMYRRLSEGEGAKLQEKGNVILVAKKGQKGCGKEKPGGADKDK